MFFELWCIAAIASCIAIIIIYSKILFLKYPADKIKLLKHLKIFKNKTKHTINIEANKAKSVYTGYKELEKICVDAYNKKPKQDGSVYCKYANYLNLSDNNRRLYSKIADSIKAHKSTINFDKSISKESLMKIFNLVINDDKTLKEACSQCDTLKDGEILTLMLIYHK